MRKVAHICTWLSWLGLAGILLVVAAMAAFDIAAMTGYRNPGLHTAAQLPLQHGLRASFLLISVAALWGLYRPPADRWRWAAGTATAVLACGVVVSSLVFAAGQAWIAESVFRLGAMDSLGHRLLRLGSMAMFAVPTLTLLAAVEQQRNAGQRSVSAGLVALLLRWEPALFAIGAATLGTILAAGALLHQEILWLSPLGADTTIAGCAAAAIRAHSRHDPLARNSWILLCTSMTVGLLMGGYSFGGPLPAPGFVGQYSALPRIILRDSHVILICLGVAGVTLAALRRTRQGAT